MAKNKLNLLREFNEQSIDLLSNSYKTLASVDNINGITLSHEPYTHCLIDNLINDSQFQQELKLELLQLKFKRKNNDLYKFYQTNDLKKCKSKAIVKLMRILYNEFLGLLKRITNIELSNDIIDMTSSKYTYSDYLLCHDDDIHGEQQGRRIAFVYYLIDLDWSQEDGGCLDLFKVNEQCEPTQVCKSLVPCNNRLVFFEVSDRSYHQVSEILTCNKQRLSVHGWFHGPVNERPTRLSEPLHTTQNYLQVNDDLFFEFILEKYIEPFNQSEIQEKFVESSEIKLDKFLSDLKYEQVREAFNSKEIKWINKGPRHRRNYDIADEDTLPQIIKNLIQVLKSDYMGLLVSNLTGLALHSTCTKSNEAQSIANSVSLEENVDNYEPLNKKLFKNQEPRVHLEVRKWSHGSYTLITDDDVNLQLNALDVMIFFTSFDCDNVEWKQSYGGCVSYISRDEDETLLQIVPENNCLTMVYRDTQTLKFTKYLNTKMKHNLFEISLVYYE